MLSSSRDLPVLGVRTGRLTVIVSIVVAFTVLFLFFAQFNMMARHLEGVPHAPQLLSEIISSGLIFALFSCLMGYALWQSRENKRLEDKRKIAQQEGALRAIDERFRLLVQGARDYAIILLDPQGHILSWNEGAQNIAGYTEDEIVWKHFSVFYTKQDILAGKPDLELRLAEQNGVYEEEGERVRKDGTLYASHVVVRPLRDESGKLTGFAKITHDISERVKAEKQVTSISRFPAERPAPVLRVTQDGKILYANAASRILFDTWKQKERVPENFKVLLNEAIGTGETKETEVVCGESIFAIAIVPIVEEGYLNLYASDVTRRVQAEQALLQLNQVLEKKVEERTLQFNEVNQNFQKLVTSIREVFYVLDPAQKNCLFISPAFESVWGRRRELIIDDFRQCLPFIHSQDRARVELALEDLNFLKPTDIQYRVVREDGRTIWIHDRAFPIIDTDGQLKSIVGIQEDITDRTEAQSLLEESERRFKTMANSSPVLLWMSGQNSLCNFFNQRWIEFTGKPLDEELGVGWAEGIHPEDLQRSLDIYMECFSQRRAFEMVYRLRRHDGQFRWILDNGIPRYGTDGVFQGFIGSCIDVTERKEAEDDLRQMADHLVRTNEELERFAYVASHDLQEPIRTIVNFTQLLSRQYGTTFTPEAKEIMDYILSGAKRMSELVRDLLAYARVDKGTEKFQEVDCTEVLQSVLSDLSARIDETKAKVVLGTMPTVMGDTVRLTQVFSNLLTNALKFRGKEPPVIHLSAQKTGKQWEFSVQDNGIGLEMRDASKIFTVFQRLHTRTEYPGSGIGLAVCKKIVESHGGKIWVKSEPQNGSTFYFTLSAELNRPVQQMWGES